MLVKALLSTRLRPIGRGNVFSDLEDVLICFPGDLKSVPLLELHSAMGPNIPSDVLRELWNAAHAFGPRLDQLPNILPFSSGSPIFDAFSMAADLKGKAAEDSEFGSHHRRKAQSLRLGDAAAHPGGPARRTKQPMDNARAPAEIREFIDFGRRLNIHRQTDLSSACVKSGIKCWGLFRDLNMLPHFPPTELFVLRRSSFFPPGRTFRMYLAHLVTARQLNDYNATSRYTDRA